MVHKDLKIGIAVTLLVLILGVLFFVVNKYQDSRVEVGGNEIVEGTSSARSNDARRAKEPDWEQTPVPDVANSPPVSTSLRGREPETSKFGAIKFKVIWEDDGQSIPLLGVSVLSWNQSNPLARRLHKATNLDGEASFSQVPTGLVAIGTDLGGGESLDLKPGEVRNVVLKIETGITVKGVVLDGEDQPVAGASITNQLPFLGQKLAETMADGRFRVRGLKNFSKVAAISEHFAPSYGYPVRGKSGDILELIIRLENRGKTLRGKVVNVDGEAISSARVLVGESRNFSHEISKNVWGSIAPAFLVRTDEYGMFEAGPVLLYRQPLIVRARGYAPSQTTFSLKEAQDDPLVVTLEKAVIVTGVVRNGKGIPVPKAFVGVGGYGDFASAQTRSDKTGRFRLEDLPADFEIRASGPDRNKATGELHGDPGAVVTWNPVLSGGRVLRGSLADGEGKPLVNWIVQARLQSRMGPWRGTDKSKADGSFLIKDCPKEKMIVEFRKPKQWSGFAQEILRNVVWDQGELLVQIKSEEIPSAWVFGQVLWTFSGAKQTGSIAAWEKNSNSAPNYPLEKDGYFKIGPLPPGPFRFTLSVPGYPRVALGKHTLFVDQRLDLGNIVIGEPGYLTVLGVDAQGEPKDLKNCRLRDESGSVYIDLLGSGSKRKSEAIAPGRYRFELLGLFVVDEKTRTGTSKVLATRTVAIKSGETQTLEIVVQ